jgi:hypothetical protein
MIGRKCKLNYKVFIISYFIIAILVSLFSSIAIIIFCNGSIEWIYSYQYEKYMFSKIFCLIFTIVMFSGWFILAYENNYFRKSIK